MSDHQRGKCLVCEFPLSLGLHLHHVIARDDGGPAHPLNLVALCPNHHLVLERIRRDIAPTETHNRPHWQPRAEAAARFIDTLSGTDRRLFDRLSTPHPLRDPMKAGVDKALQEVLARDVAHADTRMLLEANAARPGALLVWRIAQGRCKAPVNDSEYEDAVSSITNSICGLDVADVVEAHLYRLGLPYEAAWISDIRLE